MSPLSGPAVARRSWIGIMIVGVATQGIAARITAIQIRYRGTFGNPRTAVTNVSTKLEIPSAIATGTVRIADAC